MQAGFVNIFGKPNAGKSTLFNAILGNKLSIITNKAQTTRNRIKGFLNKKDEYQIILSDTPGILDPAYTLQTKMMEVIHNAYQDTDVCIILFDVKNPINELIEINEKIKLNAPKICVLNKIDLINNTQLNEKIQQIEQLQLFHRIIAISALQNKSIDILIKEMVQILPVHPPYYSQDDELSDLPVRFFISEIIREKIFLLYQEEIPYHTNIEIESYKESPKIVKIKANIMVQRESQKIIIIGLKGAKIKQLGILARKDIEAFIQQNVYLELFVKVQENWRENEQVLSKIIF